MQNKRGQGLSVNTLILIVLGIAILILLIMGFRAGWSKILPWINPPQNVQSVIDKCNSACVVGGKYDYCNANRELKTEDDLIVALSDGTEINFGKVVKASCSEIEMAFGDVIGMGDCPALAGQCSGITYSTEDFAKIACDKETESGEVVYVGGKLTC